MKIIELFSGNADLTKTLNRHNMECVSVDYDENKPADLHADVYDLTPNFLKQFDFIWASPDCTTYSLASHGKHRIKGGLPVSDYAIYCDEKNEKFIAMLKRLDIPFIIENPRAHFRNMEFTQGLYKCCVYYSQYGAPYAKPTDLFSNRPIEKYFDTSRKLTGVHLDYCKGYGDFLGRCKMPDGLLENIAFAIVQILRKEQQND